MTNDEAIAFLESLESNDEIKNPLGLLEKLREANAEAKANREHAETLQAELDTANKFKQGSKQHAIVRELKAAGVKNAEKITRLMKLEDIEFDAEGALTGFEEQLESTRTDWPELFDPKRNAPQIDQYENREPEGALSATQQQLAKLRQASGI